MHLYVGIERRPPPPHQMACLTLAPVYLIDDGEMSGVSLPVPLPGTPGSHPHARLALLSSRYCLHWYQHHPAPICHRIVPGDSRDPGHGIPGYSMLLCCIHRTIPSDRCCHTPHTKALGGTGSDVPPSDSSDIRASNTTPPSIARRGETPVFPHTLRTQCQAEMEGRLLSPSSRAQALLDACYRRRIFVVPIPATTASSTACYKRRSSIPCLLDMVPPTYRMPHTSSSALRSHSP